MNEQLDTLLNNMVEERNRAASLPESREMSLALIKLDEAIMWASAAKTIIQINADMAKQPPA